MHSFGNGVERARHLWFLISDAAAETVVIVNVSSIKGAHDSACVVQAGEHPFVTHPSFVYYADAICAQRVKLEALLLSLRPQDRHESASPVLLRRMQEGVMKGDCEPRCRRILLDQGLVTDKRRRPR